MANVVRYYLMVRPIHPTANRPILGQTGGATVTPEGTEKGATLWYPKALVAGNFGKLSLTEPMTDADPDVAQVRGEPWLIDSMHNSLDSAIEKLSLVGSLIGMANVRIFRQVDVASYVRLV